MDCRIFTYFAAVEKHRNFSRAAQELYMSPQGLNAAMRRLEGELGVSLFTVQRGMVELTEHGECFSRYAREVDEQLKAMRENMNTISSRTSHCIRLGCAIGVLGYLGEDKITHFNESNGRSKVVVEEELPDFLCEQNMLEGKYDFVLITNPVEHHDLIAFSLCEDYQFCWVSKDDALADRPEISVHDFDGRATMTVGEGYKGTAVFLSLCAVANVSPEIRYSSEMMRIYEFARTGSGIGLTCRNHVDCTPSTNVVGIPFKDLPWGFSICYKKDRILSESDVSFLNYMRSLRRVYR